MKKKRIRLKDKKLQTLLQSGGRRGAKKDFVELIKRAVR